MNDTNSIHVSKKVTPRQSLIQHIRGINKHLTPEYLENLSDEELLCEAHPVYREDHAKALGIETKKKNYYD